MRPKEADQKVELSRKEEFSKAMKIIASTPHGKLVLDTIIEATQVWAHRPEKNQDMEHFMGRRSIGIFILENLR